MKIKFELTGYDLKKIAMVTMFIDHLAILISEYISTDLYMFMRAIGRIAFPLYAFLLIEGFRNTRDKWKYALNLLIFAVISEPLFDYFLYGSIFNRETTNVFFTLLLSLVAMNLCGEIQQKMQNMFLAWLSSLFIFSVVLFLGDTFYVDYGSLGVGLLLLLFSATSFTYVFLDLFKNMDVTHVKNIICIIVILIWVLMYNAKRGISLEWFALLSCIFIFFYNGERGEYKLSKYFYYGFYPGHLTLFSVVRFLIGG